MKQYKVGVPYKSTLFLWKGDIAWYRIALYDDKLNRRNIKLGFRLIRRNTNV